MSDRISHFTVTDVRFPTSATLDGSDAMNEAPDYSAAYVVIHTTGGASGHGFVFTIGRGNEVATAALKAIEPMLVGVETASLFADMGEYSRRLVGESQLRWLGPEKGVMHMAIGAVLNALWDLYARDRQMPLWQALSRMSPEQLVSLVDFRYLSDTLSPEEALELLQAAESGRAEREQRLIAEGYPAYTTSAGWLGYSDEKIARLVKEALVDGFTHLKLKVGKDLDDDERRIKMVRELVGPAIRLSIDANQYWERAQAIESVDRLREYGLYWVEEPTSPDDILAHVAIAEAAAPILVATGEHVANRVIFKQMLAARAIGVCQIDACRVAGVNENIAILLLAAKFGVPVCPHAGGVGLCEAVQHLSMFDYVAVSGTREGRWIEYVDHLHEHFETPVKIVDGHYAAPLAPGGGGAMLPASVAQFSFPSGPVWSGREVGAA